MDRHNQEPTHRMMARPMVLAVVDVASTDKVLSYWIIPTSCGVGSDMMEYVPGLESIPVGAETLYTTESWLESLEKVSDEPSDIYLVFGTIKGNCYVIYMMDNNRSSTGRTHKFAIFNPPTYSKAAAKLRKAKSRVLENRNVMARPMIQQRLDGIQMLWFTKPLKFEKDPSRGRQPEILMNDRFFRQFVAGANSGATKIYRCMTLSKAQTKRTNEHLDTVPRKSSTKPSVIIDKETTRRFHAATSSESENIQQLAKRSVGTCYVIAPTKMLKPEEELNKKGRRLFKNIVTDICVHGRYPFFGELINAENLAKMWRSLRTPMQMGIEEAKPFDEALGAAAALLLYSPNFRVSTLPSDRVYCGRLRLDTDQFLSEAIIDVAVSPMGESKWAKLPTEEKNDHIERIYKKVEEAMHKEDSGWGKNFWIHNTVVLSTRLIRQLQAGKGENTVAIPLNGALSEALKWEYEGDDHVRVKGEDGSCELLEEVVNSVCYYFVKAETSRFKSSHTAAALEMSALDRRPISIPGGFALVATIGIVFLEAIQRGAQKSGKVKMKVKTYNSKAKGTKVECDLDKLFTDDDEVARNLLNLEVGKATRLMVEVLRLLEVKNCKIRTGFGVDGSVNTSTGDKGFLVMNPLPSRELATAVPGKSTGLPKNVSGLTADRVHLMYPTALGMGLTRELCPQTVELQAAQNTRLRPRYEKQVSKLRQKNPAISSGPTITRIMSYSPTLLEAHKDFQDTCAKDLLNSNTFITELPGKGTCANIETAKKNLELCAKLAGGTLDDIRTFGGTGRLEVQFALDGNLDAFEENFVASVKSLLAIARLSAVVVSAQDVADNMEVALTALIALGKASLELLSRCGYTHYKFSESQRIAESPIVWEYVMKSLARFYSGRDICYQQASCIPRESILIAGRPLFNPTWECTYDVLLRVQGSNDNLKRLVQALLTPETTHFFTTAYSYRQKYRDLVENASSGTGRFEALSMYQCRARKGDGKKVADGAVASAYCAACYQRFSGGSYVTHPCVIGSEYKGPNGESVIVTGAEKSIVHPNSARFHCHLQSLEGQLNDNQATTYEEIIFHPDINFYVGGDAGSGKSHLLRVLVRALDCSLLDTRRLTVVSMTNIAANNIGGRTVNSWLMLAPHCDDAAGKAYGVNPAGHCNSKFIEIASDVARNLEGRREEFQILEVLIIDEVFLLTGHMFALIDAVLRELRSCRDIPFGGVQVVAFGDAQLPPIGNSWSWFFASETFTNGNFKVCLLTEVVRQKDAKDKEQLKMLKLGGGENPVKFLEDVNSSWGSAVTESDLLLCERAWKVYKGKIDTLQTRLNCCYLERSRVEDRQDRPTHRVKRKDPQSNSLNFLSSHSERAPGQLKVLYIVTEVCQEEAYEDIWLQDVQGSDIEIQLEVPTVTIVVSKDDKSATLSFGRNGDIVFSEEDVNRALISAQFGSFDRKYVYDGISTLLKKHKIKLEGRALFEGENVRCLVKSAENLAITKQAVVRVDSLDVEVGTITLSAYPVRGKGQSSPVTLERQIFAEETKILKGSGVQLKLSCFGLPVRPIVACTDRSLQALEFSIPIVYDNTLVGGPRCSNCCGKAYMVASRALSCSQVYFLFPINRVELKPDEMAKDFFEYHRTRSVVDYHYVGKRRIVHSSSEQEEEGAFEIQDPMEDYEPVKDVTEVQQKKSKLTLNTNIRVNIKSMAALQAAGLTFSGGDGFQKATVKANWNSTYDLCTERLKSEQSCSLLSSSSSSSSSSSLMQIADADEENSHEQDDPYYEGLDSTSGNTSFETESSGERTLSPSENRKYRRLDAEDLKPDAHLKKAFIVKPERIHSRAVREIKQSFPSLLHSKKSAIVWGEKHPNRDSHAKKALWSLQEQIWMVTWIRRFASTLPGRDYINHEQKMASIAQDSLFTDKDAHQVFHPKHIGHNWKEGFNHKAKPIDELWGYRHQARILQKQRRSALLVGKKGSEYIRQVMVDTYVADVPWEEKEDDWLRKWTELHPTWNEANYGEMCFLDLIADAVTQAFKNNSDLLAAFHPHHVYEPVLAKRLQVLFGIGEGFLQEEAYNEGTSCEVNNCFFRNFAEQKRVEETQALRYWFPTDGDTSEGLVSSSPSRNSAKPLSSQVFKDERTPSPLPARKYLRVDSDDFIRKRSLSSVKRIICDE